TSNRGSFPGEGVFQPIQNALAAHQQRAALSIDARTRLTSEGTDGNLIRGVGRGNEIADLATTLVSVEVRLLDEIANARAQRLGQQLGVETPHELKIKVDLHVEIVQAEIAEVAIEESVIGDLVECLGTRVFEAVVVTKRVAEKPLFVQQFVLKTGTGVGFRATEIEGILVMAFHEPEVDDNLIQDCVGLKHEQVVSDMNVEVVQDSEGIEHLSDGLLSIQVTKAVLRRVLDSEENSEEAEVIQNADRLFRNTVGPRLDGNRNLADPVAAKLVTNGREARGSLGRVGQEEVVILEIEDADAVAVI